MIKSRRMGWAWNVARMGKKRNDIRFWRERLDHYEDLDVSGRITLKWILEK
jgi:hypothetical protein